MYIFVIHRLVVIRTEPIVPTWVTRIMPLPCTDYHSPLCGEERVHMVRAGRVCEGDIPDEIKTANRQLMRTTMKEGKVHMR